ncbi:hypothetical protein BC833DRAFT_180240 [Globomyces pollinis-pini]|nr:hypothetical protein BC833DRAFT_180240 [Globomyces pollinis-pini]
MIDYQPSIKRVISYSNDPNELIRLAHLFIRMPLKSDRILKILAVIKSLKQFNQENRSTISYEIEQASNYLLNNKNQIDNARSSRWFREMGNLNVRQKLVELKFDRFKVEFNSTPIDSVVIANYIKSLLREMKDGLIPESIQLLLIDLFDDDITDNTIQMTFILLSFCRSRFQILKSILNVCKKILTDCTIDPITPYDLAHYSN